MEENQPQTETVEEPQKEETSKETSQEVSPEKETVSKDDEWKRMMQSRTDTAEAKAQKFEKELQEFRKREEQQRLAARQKEISDLEGDTDAQAQARRKHQLEDDLLRLEEQKAQEEGAVQRKYDQALELASKHNLGLADARELMNAGTPKEMELLAQLKVAEISKSSQPLVEPKEGFKPDSGTSDAGATDDEQFMKDYAAGKSDDHARAQKILNKI